ncbi:MAG: DEAD/DEAH box helicase family protein [Candidatus Eisenbacteria bacterium]|nr:DEAD/DEAH box helicase family protein [Candidatus Eisenbacteria bacterium]
MIGIKTAGQLLNFGARMGEGPRAEEQLEGAVALHNILETHGVAYLADEVGMGKTYVALGAVALFRHFQPGFRVLFLAPRANIQQKWMKEFRNFVAYNLRYPDMRVAALDRQPARPLVSCENLIDFLHEALVDHERDFFLRLPSFSLALGDGADRGSWRRLRDQLQRELPWMPEGLFDLRSPKETFKENFARALCAAIPRFDLVVVDEGHNLKHGLGAGVSTRNRLVSLVFGRERVSGQDVQLPGYGPRAQRVLFLSATPLEESYEQIWNQLDVFGQGAKWTELRSRTATEEEKRQIAAQFLVRRVTSMRIGNQEWTKNLYRREWRRGGVRFHDEPLRMTDPRQRLIVALVQKKVAEVLDSEAFNMSFQVGMLASFESFLETAKVHVKAGTDADGAESTPSGGGESGTNFDDAEQTLGIANDRMRAAHREGIDVQDLNRLAADYRRIFGGEMPHPKMDGLVERLASAWTTGEKALVFVRRIRSVGELKRKLDERYDEWLIGGLRERLPASVRGALEELLAQYREEKLEVLESRRAADSRRAERVRRKGPAAHLPDPQAKEPVEAERTSEWDGPPDSKERGEPREPRDRVESDLEVHGDADDRGGTDTFFAWFFRGEGPEGVLSGASLQRRFLSASGAYATFFEENYVRYLLNAPCGGVADALARHLEMEPEGLQSELRRRASRYLRPRDRVPRRERMDAAQAAALELLAAREGELAEWAQVIRSARFLDTASPGPEWSGPDVTAGLEESTFFSELRSPGRAHLREAIWPEVTRGTISERFRESELRAQMLATAARLGHSLIDLYALVIARLDSLQLRQQEREDPAELIDAYLDLLERARTIPRDQRPWAAFDELSQIAQNFELILDVNLPTARTMPLAEAGRTFGALLREQQPVGGMSGSVNRTLVQQFRLPGYPLILITTDLLQEGEDLHTFCSAVHHYGIAWTPSAMEQRVGRVDRVRSLSDRRLNGSESDPEASSLLQIYYPHLEDTVEVLQVRRVLTRMNQFLRLMHEGLSIPQGDERRIDVHREIIADRRPVEAIRDRLRTAFPVPAWALRGERRKLAVERECAERIEGRFHSLINHQFEFPGLHWDPRTREGTLVGRALLSTGRQQSFTLRLLSSGDHPLVRCISPIGRCLQPGGSGGGADENRWVEGADEESVERILASARSLSAHLGAKLGKRPHTYDLTVEDDVLLGDPEYDIERVRLLLHRVVDRADSLERRHLDTDRPHAPFADDLAREGEAFDA